ncbi:MAG: hypothetical protein M5U19_16930 [Microthrixaceae bacterium]|nr:hypothetical protein [Microthrixaceae bacterium]
MTSQTLEMMNPGARLDEIVHSVTVPPALTERPWLQPVYDDPEFIGAQRVASLRRLVRRRPVAPQAGTGAPARRRRSSGWQEERTF